MSSIFLTGFVPIYLRTSSHTRQSLMRPLLFGILEQKSGPSLISFIAACFSGVVFGAVHCLGWNIVLRRTEHIRWRVASIGATCSPLMTFSAICFACFRGHTTDDKGPVHDRMDRPIHQCFRGSFYQTFVHLFTSYNACTCVHELTITASRRIRYDSLDQAYPTHKSVFFLYNRFM
jgi:hypothetical protein